MLANQRKVKASVIIPNWNGEEFLKICLPSLKKQTFKQFEVVVVDNGSTDGSKEYIKKLFPEIKLVELPVNLGFAQAVNIGVKVCCGEYMILINNDTKVDPNCLEYLVKTADKNSQVGMVACKMLNFYNPKLIDSAGDYIDAVGHANNLGLGEKDGEKFSKEGSVFLVTGGGGLFKREVFEKIGFFDPDYFAYFEDVDFCLRAQLAGFRARFEPKAVVYHIHKGTSNRNKAFTEYLQFRNMTMTVIKNFPSKLLLKDFNLLKIFLVNINTMRYLALKGYFIEALKAEYFILANFFKLLRKRSEIQSKIEVPIDYFIENIQPKKITFFGLFKSGI